ncbi:MAG: DUF4149 domain-containing protein [Chlorobiota bacterium]|jgi:putative copper export protein|nr:DUF4149 domain-containing protein [Chlorobiota bacterium]
MHWAYIASVLLHILAATFWLGGMLFLAIVVVPALRGAPERARLLERMGKLFERASVIALAVLLVTGVVNLLFRGVAQVSDLWSSPVGRMGALKLALFVVMAILSLWHNVVLGRRALALLQQGREDPHAARWVLWSRWVGRLLVLLSVILVLLGVLISRGIGL